MVFRTRRPLWRSANGVILMQELNKGCGPIQGDKGNGTEPKDILSSFRKIKLEIQTQSTPFMSLKETGLATIIGSRARQLHTRNMYLVCKWHVSIIWTKELREVRVLSSLGMHIQGGNVPKRPYGKGTAPLQGTFSRFLFSLIDIFSPNIVTHCCEFLCITKFIY